VWGQRGLRIGSTSPANHHQETGDAPAAATTTMCAVWSKISSEGLARTQEVGMQCISSRMSAKHSMYEMLIALGLVCGTYPGRLHPAAAAVAGAPSSQVRPSSRQGPLDPSLDLGTRTST
jgi:hypothetical protein